MNKFLATLVVIVALWLAITHATPLTNTRLHARGTAFLEAQSLGMISQDWKKDRKTIRACFRGCRKTKRQCRKSCRKDKDCKKRCRDTLKDCKNFCEGEGSGAS